MQKRRNSVEFRAMALPPNFITAFGTSGFRDLIQKYLSETKSNF